jgi:hypothetical protein
MSAPMPGLPLSLSEATSRLEEADLELIQLSQRRESCYRDALQANGDRKKAGALGEELGRLDANIAQLTAEQARLRNRAVFLASQAAVTNRAVAMTAYQNLMARLPEVKEAREALVAQAMELALALMMVASEFNEANRELQNLRAGLESAAFRAGQPVPPGLPTTGWAELTLPTHDGFGLRFDDIFRCMTHQRIQGRTKVMALARLKDLLSKLDPKELRGFDYDHNGR